MAGFVEVCQAANVPAAPLVVRAAVHDDYGGWAALFRRYRDFYRLEPDEAVVERVWSWILDVGHETRAVVAVRGNAVVGLAHYRRFARPSTGTVGMYLDDLMTDPAYRGAGVGRALIDAVTEIAAFEGCSLVRWITAADNASSQSLYDALATTTTWVTYDRPCGQPPGRGSD